MKHRFRCRECPRRFATVQSFRLHVHDTGHMRRAYNEVAWRARPIAGSRATGVDVEIERVFRDGGTLDQALARYPEVSPDEHENDNRLRW